MISFIKKHRNKIAALLSLITADEFFFLSYHRKTRNKFDKESRLTMPMDAHDYNAICHCIDSYVAIKDKEQGEREVLREFESIIKKTK